MEYHQETKMIGYTVRLMEIKYRRIGDNEIQSVGLGNKIYHKVK